MYAKQTLSSRRSSEIVAVQVARQANSLRLHVAYRSEMVREENGIPSDGSEMLISDRVSYFPTPGMGGERRGQ
jgi:hypothetical protein